MNLQAGTFQTDKSQLIVHEVAMVLESEITQLPQLTGSPPWSVVLDPSDPGNRTAQ
jgi:hypothetical protein